MRVHIIEDYGSLQNLAPEWETLWKECPAATPFQSPDWQLSWWRRFGSGRLMTLVITEGKDLAGIWPLSVREEKTERTVVMNGMGISDYLDILIASEAASAGAARAVQALLERASDWDRFDFQEVREESPLLKVDFPVGMSIEMEVMQVCPAVVLPGSKDSYLAGLNPRHRRSLRRAGRLIEKAGGGSFESVEEETLSEFLDELFALHGERWVRRDQPGVLSDADVRAFHREVAPAMLGKGRLRMYRLRCAGRIISVLYLYTAGEKTFCYLGGFDPEWEQLSPGAVMIEHAIAQAIAEGQHEFDFLRGNEAYKYLWGCRDRQNYRIVITKEASDLTAFRRIS